MLQEFAVSRRQLLATVMILRLNGKSGYNREIREDCAVRLRFKRFYEFLSGQNAALGYRSQVAYRAAQNCSLPGDGNCRDAQSGDADGAFISVTGSVSINSSSALQFPQITSSPALTFLAISISAAQTGHSPIVFPVYSGLKGHHFMR